MMHTKKQTRRSRATGQKSLRGITLIETILYLAIAVFVMEAFFSYGWNIAGTNVKSTVVAQTAQSAEDIEQRITFEIHQAQSVSDISSSKIVLQENEGGNTIEVSIEASNGMVTIKRGADGAAVALHSNDVKVDNFIFTHQDSATDPIQIQYIGFSFNAVAAYSGSTISNRYQYSLPVQSGAALRTQ